MESYHAIKKSQVPVIRCMQNTQKQLLISTLVLKLESHTLYTLKLLDMTHRTVLRPGSHSVESDHLIFNGGRGGGGASRKMFSGLDCFFFHPQHDPNMSWILFSGEKSVLKFFFKKKSSPPPPP